MKVDEHCTKCDEQTGDIIEYWQAVGDFWWWVTLAAFVPIVIGSLHGGGALIWICGVSLVGAILIEVRRQHA